MAMGKAADRDNAEPTCQDCSYDLMSNPMASGSVERPAADLRRPPRAGGSFGPPTRPG